MIRQRSIIPGFGLSMGYTLAYLSALVIIPLGALILKTMQLGWREFWEVVTDPIVVDSYRVTFIASSLAAVINAVFGLVVAWVLVRYRFWGRRVLDAVVDFPLALPTAVAGLTFANLYSPEGWFGALGTNTTWVLNSALSKIGLGQPIPATALSWLNFAYTNTMGGVVIVLVFVGLPFAVRTVQPVLENWSHEFEEASWSLGAGPWSTFRRVIFPEILPAWLSGLALAFARAVGEYGSVIFISGNIPGKSQIAPLQIMTKLDDFKYAHATAIGVVLLGTSLVVLLLINGLERFSRRHEL